MTSHLFYCSESHTSLPELQGVLNFHVTFIKSYLLNNGKFWGDTGLRKPSCDVEAHPPRCNSDTQRTELTCSGLQFRHEVCVYFDWWRKDSYKLQFMEGISWHIFWLNRSNTSPLYNCNRHELQHFFFFVWFSFLHGTQIIVFTRLTSSLSSHLEYLHCLENQMTYSTGWGPELPKSLKINGSKKSSRSKVTGTVSVNQLTDIKVS